MLILDHLHQRAIESAINALISAPLHDVPIDIVNLSQSPSAYVLQHRADILRCLYRSILNSLFKSFGENLASAEGFAASAEADRAIMDRRTDEISTRSTRINARMGGRE